MEEKNEKFHHLGPITLDKSEEIYEKALDFAFKDDQIKNIAITGIYGAGKTTVWNTYVKNRKLKNIINISLGKYQDSLDVFDLEENKKKSNSNNKENKIDNENRIEKQIINQIASQIKESNIPLSKYKFKNNIRIIKILMNTVSVISIISSFIAFILREEFIGFIKNFWNDFNKIYLVIFFLITFFIPLFYLLFLFFRNNKFKISKINIKGTEANLENNENSDETIFDKDIKEIVYLLKSSKSKIIVIEDLDRYDNISIFTKLREINFLVNKNVNIKKFKGSIKFVYIIRDGLFISKNRTKFFDYILPIIPIIDSKNSENKLLDFLKESNLNDFISKELILKISLYIDNMRLLKNIINEFIIYKNIVKMEKLNLSHDKMFSLIVLKNIFPKEFDLLQENKGYIVSVFKKIQNKKNNIMKEWAGKILEIQEKIGKINERVQMSMYEIIAAHIPPYVHVENNTHFNDWPSFLKYYKENPNETFRVTKRNYFSYNNYEDFISSLNLSEHIDTKLLDEFSENKNNAISRLNEEVRDLENKITSINITSIKDFLINMEVENINNIFENENEHDSNIDFRLIKFLILDGYIDETYNYYMSLFHPGSLKENDTIFMKNLYSGEKQDIFLEIETPEEIVNRLKADDFKRFNIFNMILFKFCLENDKLEEIKNIISSRSFKDNKAHIVKEIDKFENNLIDKFANFLIKYDINILFDTLNFLEKNRENIIKNNREILEDLINYQKTSDKLFEISLNLLNNDIERINYELPRNRITKLLKNNFVKITNNDIKQLLDKEYYDEIVKLITSENNEKSLLARESIKNLTVTPNFIYELSKVDNIDDLLENLIEKIENELLIEKVDNKNKILKEKIIKKFLTEKNINYICNNFSDFDLKKEFIAELLSKTKITELNEENLTSSFMIFILENQNFTIDTKIDLITKKIKSKEEESQIFNYISLVKEISKISLIISKRDVKITNQYEDAIAKKLEEYGYLEILNKNGNKKIKLIKK